MHHAHIIEHSEERLRAGTDWKDEGWGFPGHTDDAWGTNNVGRVFRAPTKAAGVEDKPFHALRHGAAGVLLGAGVAVDVAAKMMEHGHVSTFRDIYADLLGEASQDAARCGEAFLTEQEDGGERGEAVGGVP